MGRTKTVTGVIVYKNIGLGFWGIEGFDGEKWLPINLPKSLQQEGKRVTLRIKKLDGDNIQMWGQTVEIVK